MPLFVMIGTDGAQGLERRPAVRPRHLEHLAPLSRAGRVPLAGPLLGDDGTTPRGSMVVLEAPSLADARAIAERDPYVVEGVFARWELYPFKQVFPEPDA